jgi:hypothetical protein
VCESQRRLLLRQPASFEGFVPACEPLTADGLSLPVRPEEPDVPVCLDTALFSAPSHGLRNEHLIARLDQLMDLHTKVGELVQERLQESSESVRPSVHAPGAGDRPRGDVFKVRRGVRERGVEVASVDRLDGGAGDLHVPLRHRPLSIPLWR